VTPRTYDLAPTTAKDVLHWKLLYWPNMLSNAMQAHRSNQMLLTSASWHSKSVNRLLHGHVLFPSKNLDPWPIITRNVKLTKFCHQPHMMSGVPRGISISPAVHRAGNPIIAFYSLNYRNIFRSNRIFVFGFGIEERWFLCAKNRIWRQSFTSSTMDQRTICLYLSRKGFSAHAIHEELVQLIGPDVIAY
jgi:hypothetical protein